MLERIDKQVQEATNAYSTDTDVFFGPPSFFFFHKRPRVLCERRDGDARAFWARFRKRGALFEKSA